MTSLDSAEGFGLPGVDSCGIRSADRLEGTAGREGGDVVVCADRGCAI
jgi:hypothetical protein